MPGSYVDCFTTPSTFSMHAEEIYTSLQWDIPTSEASQKCQSPSKCSGAWCVVTMISCVVCMGLLATSIFLGIKFFQVSSLVLEQQERLIQQDTALVNLTQWQRKYTLEYCQALLQRSLHSGTDASTGPVLLTSPQMVPQTLDSKETVTAALVHTTGFRMEKVVTMSLNAGKCGTSVRRAV